MCSDADARPFLPTPLREMHMCLKKTNLLNILHSGEIKLQHEMICESPTCILVQK